ncbi:hypothetical protein Q0590_26705 [Rhodocytophaga aerolata]|uniref:Outer membrane protein beta-barrel domain-containing protein n=1 Tax=Rhodocytophaga aerolata TaxID=455078 RepID=A0ABT8RD15_9BACT|nr:hypothetical protein [Rhodocytophaga aerolata]MDO1449899.1 hypothetical protein [Rhodocytophaga aerolata]
MIKQNHAYLFLYAFLLFPLSCFGQTEKGSKLLGGSGSIQFYDPFSISIFPDVGFFVKDNLALGSGIPASFSTDSRTDFVSLGLSPFARFYLGQTTLRYFLTAEVGYRHTWNTYTFQQDKLQQSYNTWDIRGGAGAVYFITQQVGLEALLSYGTFRTYVSGETILNRLNLVVGFQIYLPAKQ